MNEQSEQAWVAGFTKAANEAGITEPAEIEHLMAQTKRAALATAHPVAYLDGFTGAAKEAGLDKDAVWPLIGGVGAVGGNLAAQGINQAGSWNKMDNKDMQAGYDAYKSKGLFGKGIARMFRPGMMKAVKGHEANMQQAFQRQQNPAQYQAYAKQQATEAQNKADAWGGGGGGSPSSRGGSYYGRHYRRPRY
jgi:hypothetical protein